MKNNLRETGTSLTSKKQFPDKKQFQYSVAAQVGGAPGTQSSGLKPSPRMLS